MKRGNERWRVRYTDRHREWEREGGKPSLTQLFYLKCCGGQAIISCQTEWKQRQTAERRGERESETTKRQQSSLAKASPLKSQAIKRHPLPHSDISAATMGACFSSVIYKVVLQLESCIHSWPTWVSPLTAERLESLSLEHMFQILHLRMSRAFNISINGNHTLFLSNRLSHSVNLIILNDSQTQLRGWYL